MGWEHMISVQVQSDQLAHASGDRLTRKALSALARNRERAGEIQMSTQQAGTGCWGGGGGGSAPRVLPVAGSAASESQTGGAGFSRLVQKETAHQGDPRRSNTPFGISNIASFFSSEGPETSAGGEAGGTCSGGRREQRLRQ